MTFAHLSADVELLTFAIHAARSLCNYDEMLKLIRLRDFMYDGLPHAEREKYRMWARLRVESLPGGDPFCVPHLINLITG